MEKLDSPYEKFEFPMENLRLPQEKLGFPEESYCFPPKIKHISVRSQSVPIAMIPIISFREKSENDGFPRAFLKISENDKKLDIFPSEPS